MSNAVFPSEIGQGTTGSNSWGFRLPIHKTPSYKTLVHTPANNAGEVRISLTPFPIWLFNLDLAWMRGDFSPAQVNSAVQQIVGFYGQMQGMADDWLYFDPSDNGSNLTTVNAGATLTDLIPYSFRTGDDATTMFPTSRTFGGMKDLVQNWVGAFPLVYVNGVLNNLWTLTTSGMLNFVTAPAAGATLVLYGQFYFRCRFLDDEWADLHTLKSQIWANPKLRFKSILV
jgi:hypothetical protein